LVTLSKDFCMTPSCQKSHCKKIIYVLGPGLTSTSSNVDSARMNLASSYVNGFVNAAFGQDKLLTGEGNKWIYKNKEHGNFPFDKM